MKRFRYQGGLGKAISMVNTTRSRGGSWTRKAKQHKAIEISCRSCGSIVGLECGFDSLFVWDCGLIMTMTLVSTVTVGSGGASSIEWTSIPQSGKDLLILLSARAASNAIRNDVGVSFNGVTTNRTYRSLYGNGFNAFGSNGGQISTFAGATAANADCVAERVSH